MTQQKIEDVSASKQTSTETIISSKEALLAFLEKAVRYGYNQIRLPAGTSLFGDYSAQVCILRKIDKWWYVGLLPYNSRANKDRDKTQPKKKKPTGETPEGTGAREVDEEFKIKVSNLIEFFRKQDNGKPESRPVDEEKKHLYKEHLVHRYITFDFEGEIAYFPEFRNPNDPETAQGFWLRLDLVDTEVKMDFNRPAKPLVFFKHVETLAGGTEEVLKKLDPYEDEAFAKSLYYTLQNLLNSL